MDNIDLTELKELFEDVKEILILKLQPGDSLVVKLDDIMKPNEMQRIKEQIERYIPLPEGVKVVVIDDRMDFKVLRGCNEN